MFKVYRTNGDFYAAIPDNTTIGPNIPSQTSTPVNLVGRNKVSYGVSQNENFVWLTENFCNTTQPVAAIKGQFWYDTTYDLGSGGELKLAVKDSAGTGNWASVPVISNVSTLPSSSNEGRILIYKDNALRIRMNSDWYTIVTESPNSSSVQASLDINNNYDSTGDGTYDSVYLNSQSTTFNIARYNDGAYLETASTIGGTTSGVLRYGKSYAFTARVICSVKDTPSIYKAWDINGSFYVAKAANQSGDPDPRKISAVSATVTPITGSSSTLSYLNVVVNNDTSTPPTGTTVANIVTGSYYGLLFNAIMSSHTDVVLNWCITMNLNSI